MKDKEKLLSTLLKGAIVAAGTGVGMLIAKCFSVKEDPEGEPDEPEVIDADFEEVGETEEV